MDPIKKISLIGTAASRLKELIGSGELSEGDELPSERELSVKLQVSTAAVREAVITLQALGIIEIKRGIGFVAKIDEDIAQSATQWFSEHFVQMGDYMEARQAIEATAAKLAAQRAKEDEIAQIEHIHKEFEKAIESNDVVGTVEADKAFHNAIIKATHNRVLAIINHKLEKAFEKYRIKSFSISKSAQGTLIQHRGILDALINRKPDQAEAEMIRHLDMAQKKFNGMDGD